MDLLLEPFLRARDEATRQAQLQELLLMHAGPIVRHLLRQKLAFFISTTGTQPYPPAAADVWQDIMTKLVAVLSDPQLRSGAKEIHNFGGLVSRLTSNACRDYWRTQAPNRARLANRVREVVERHPSFAAWQQGAVTLYGFAPWRGQTPTAHTLAQATRLETATRREQLHWLALSETPEMPLPHVLAALFRWLDGPLASERLHALLVLVLEVRETLTVAWTPEDEAELPAPPQARAPALPDSEAAALLHQCWATVKQLPNAQRLALCLGFADADGEDFFTWLTAQGVVDWAELAAGLEVSVPEVLAWWPQLPMTNEQIAVILGATRAQVSKWKFRAHEQLANALRRVRAAP